MHKLSETVERKFEDVIYLEPGWEIETDTGWQSIQSIMKTVPYQTWCVVLEDNITFKCADTHIVFLSDYSEIFVCDLLPGQKIITEFGEKAVIQVYSIETCDNMYDISINSPDQRYYANKVLHHNSTVASAYLLWYAMFRDNSTILVVANNASQAYEIMQKIRYAYEEIPDHIRAGGVSYNKGTIEFDNGSRIISRATTAYSGRGLSITLLYADEFAFVQPNMAEEFWTAIQPTLSTGGGCILTSTPNGDNDIFAQVWRGATDTIGPNGIPTLGGVGRNGFKAFQATWHCHPDRDEKWADTYRNQIGEEKFKREFDCCVADTMLDCVDELGNSFKISIGDLYKKLSV